MRWIKLVLKRVTQLGILVAFLLAGTFSWVNWQTHEFIHDDPQEVGTYRVGLVLGTSKKTVKGRPNLFFTRRMDAAAELFRAGKVRHLLVSGDNGIKEYNEPEDMRRALMERGVPAGAITLDYAGFRTLDSVVRCKEVFGQDEYVVISQAFHTQRAVFIARTLGIAASGYNAEAVSPRYAPRTYVREVFARAKALLDVYILGTQPKFLGDPVKISA
ncbi:MAG: ElyC/SanA/YdcF family protein [Bacteroidota bacterium]